MEAPSEITHLETTETSEVNTEHVVTETHATTEHAGPHIPSARGEVIDGLAVFGIPVTNVILSTWIFMALFFVLIATFYTAIKTDKLPGLKAFGLDVVNRIFSYVSSLIGNTQIARKYMWLLGGLIVVIFVGNLFGLILDLLTLISAHEWLAKYVRPIYSDLSTTLVFSLTVIIIAQATAIVLKGPVNHYKHYLWDFHGDSIAEKIVSVFIGWLHFAGEFIRIGSLSMRLFLNIFVGAILISVVIYIGDLIPAFHTGIFRFLSLPFWFFELLVAFLQAYIFMTLSSLYIRESIPEKGHH